MRAAILLLAVVAVVSGRQLLNEDEVLDELNYGSNTRSRRALCGSEQTVRPTRDPSCLSCPCFNIGPFNKDPFSNILGKRADLSSLLNPGIINPFNPIINPIRPINPIIRPSCYARCCLALPSLGGGVKSSLSDASVKSMASNLINTFGKRADADAKFKKPSVDLIFLIDDSGSIPAPQFTVAKEGAATLSQALCPREYGSAKGQKQVSVVLFSTTAQTVISFEQSQQGGGYVEDAILGMKQRSGTTATVDAVKYVRDSVLSGPASRLSDPDTATIVFVITDGKCNQRGCGQLGAEAEKLRKLGPGVQVFAFGVGEADCDELEAIRGKEAGEVFGLPDFDFFEKLAIAVKEQMADSDSTCVSDK